MFRRHYFRNLLGTALTLCVVLVNAGFGHPASRRRLNHELLSDVDTDASNGERPKTRCALLSM